MIVIYNCIATSVSSMPLEKVNGFITYSNILSIDYMIKSSMYQLILFKLTCLFTEKSLLIVGFPGSSDSKESSSNAGDLSLILWSGRSPGEGNGNTLRYSCLENSMDREPGGLQSMGSQRVRHDWMTNTFTFNYIYRGKLNNFNNWLIRVGLYAIKNIYFKKELLSNFSNWTLF